MAKYSEEFKLMVVREYQEGKLGYRLLAKKHGMKDHTRNYEMGKSLREIRGERFNEEEE